MFFLPQDQNFYLSIVNQNYDQVLGNDKSPPIYSFGTVRFNFNIDFVKYTYKPDTNFLANFMPKIAGGASQNSITQNQLNFATFQAYFSIDQSVIITQVVLNNSPNKVTTQSVLCKIDKEFTDSSSGSLLDRFLQKNELKNVLSIHKLDQEVFTFDRDYFQIVDRPALSQNGMSNQLGPLRITIMEVGLEEAVTQYIFPNSTHNFSNFFFMKIGNTVNSHPKLLYTGFSKESGFQAWEYNMTVQFELSRNPETNRTKNEKFNLNFIFDNFPKSPFYQIRATVINNKETDTLINAVEGLGYIFKNKSREAFLDTQPYEGHNIKAPYKLKMGSKTVLNGDENYYIDGKFMDKCIPGTNICVVRLEYAMSIQFYTYSVFGERIKKQKKKNLFIEDKHFEDCFLDPQSEDGSQFYCILNSEAEKLKRRSIHLQRTSLNIDSLDNYKNSVSYKLRPNELNYESINCGAFCLQSVFHEFSQNICQCAKIGMLINRDREKMAIFQVELIGNSFSLQAGPTVALGFKYNYVRGVTGSITGAQAMESTTTNQ